MYFIYKIKILFLRIFGYEKPLRVAFLKLLSLKFKTFRPHYETILLESCREAKKLGLNEISILELGVANGNGIVSLENYKRKIEKFLDIKITIYGFDNCDGLPDSDLKEDIKYLWKDGQFKTNKEALEKEIKSKIFYGDIKDTAVNFLRTNPKNISVIFFDMDYYSSTKKFLDQINSFKNVLLPRVLLYFDDLYFDYNITEFNGEMLAINEFNVKNKNFKIGSYIDHICDFRFPLAKGLLKTLHNFNHPDYNKFIADKHSGLGLYDKKIYSDIF
jgi:hypothetical protein